MPAGCLTQLAPLLCRHDRGPGGKPKNGKLAGAPFAESAIGPAMGVPGAGSAVSATAPNLHATPAGMDRQINNMGHAPVNALELDFAGQAPSSCLCMPPPVPFGLLTAGAGHTAMCPWYPMPVHGGITMQADIEGREFWY